MVVCNEMCGQKKRRKKKKEQTFFQKIIFFQPELSNKKRTCHLLGIFVTCFFYLSNYFFSNSKAVADGDFETVISFVYYLSIFNSSEVPTDGSRKF
jgi:hypothetical protein